MQDSSKAVVVRIVTAEKPSRVLDAPCGKGWLREQLNLDCRMEGVDLYATPVPGYTRVHAHDLDRGLPREVGTFDCVICCEGIEHFGNPLRFLSDANAMLDPGGLLIVTTPNTWYPAAKLQFFARGFFPGFPCLVGQIRRGEHMHITPWSFPHLYLYLNLAGFSDIRLHDEPLSRCKRFYERALGWPQRLYCRGKFKRAGADPERAFWKAAGSEGSVYGRHLIVSARKAPDDESTGSG